ncbi:MAG: hypothetical protein DWP94_10655 [Flavobacterium sp.]|nr:MAG: hypothetical protein DWP94_10655 [Flavobacterium sp.]
MKHFSSILLVFTLLISCKEGKDNTNLEKLNIAEPELTTAEAIANRYGESNWDNVTELNFSFNVKSGLRKVKRSFQWFPKTNDVVFTSDTDTIEYNRNSNMDSLALYADKRFINDTYWLLAPFKLVWDEGVSISEEKNVTAPISGDTLHKLTILYDSEGGYTPGDAYDLYFSDDFVIKEWSYRRANAEKASTSTLWTKEKNVNGIILNTHHRDSTGNFQLFFTDVSIK